MKVVMDECEVTKEAAEAALKANEGNLKTTLLAFIRGK